MYCTHSEGSGAPGTDHDIVGSCLPFTLHFRFFFAAAWEAFLAASYRASSASIEAAEAGDVDEAEVFQKVYALR